MGTFPHICGVVCCFLSFVFSYCVHSNFVPCNISTVDFLRGTNTLEFVFFVCFLLSYDARASERCSSRGILHHRCGLLRTGRHLPQTGQTAAEQQPTQKRGRHPACKHQNTFPSPTHFPGKL